MPLSGVSGGDVIGLGLRVHLMGMCGHTDPPPHLHGQGSLRRVHSCVVQAIESTHHTPPQIKAPKQMRFPPSDG